MSIEALDWHPVWDIRDDLPELKGADYARVTERFVEVVSRLEGVAGVFQFGTVNYPGISDLDLGVVVEDGCPAETFTKLAQYKSIDDAAPKIFLHSPVVMPQTLFIKLPYLHTASNMQWLWGEPQEFDKLSDVEQKYARVANYIDWSFRAYEQLVTFLNNPRPGLRYLFVALGKCEKSLKSASWLIDKPLPVELVEIRNMVLASRSSNDKQSMVKKLMHSAMTGLNLLSAYDSKLADYLISQGEIQPSSATHMADYFEKYYLYFHGCNVKPSFKNIVCKVRFKNLGEQKNQTALILNLSNIYAAQFSTYGIFFTDSDLKRVHSDLYPPYLANIIVGEGYRSFLKKRASLASELKRFLDNGMHQAWSVGLGIGFRWPSAIKNETLKNLSNKNKSEALHAFEKDFLYKSSR